MEKAKIRPLATPKPLNRSSQKLACMITSWTAPDVQKCAAIGLEVFAPQYSNNNNNKTTIYLQGAVTWLESHYKGAAQCSLLVLWKQLVTEVGSRKQMCLEQC